ncbi:MAG: hypothetical protein HC831_27495 [Chloroflexia bacterium]|nr:hypothetical protein [Chloroflexia bacterium]
MFNTDFCTKIVTGAVTDSDGEPLPGVNVIAKDIVGIGTITDLEGSYSLEVPSDATSLVFPLLE